MNKPKSFKEQTEDVIQKYIREQNEMIKTGKPIIHPEHYMAAPVVLIYEHIKKKNQL